MLLPPGTCLPARVARNTRKDGPKAMKLPVFSTVGTTFTFSLRHFPAFYLLILLVGVPRYIYSQVPCPEWQASVVSTGAELLISGLVVALMAAVLHRDRRGESRTLLPSISDTLARSATVLGVIVLMAVYVVGLIFLGDVLSTLHPQAPMAVLVVHFILFAFICMAVPCAAVETRGVLDCFRRSVNLSAGSRLRIKRMETPADYKDLENELASVVESKKKAVESQDFEEAGRLRDSEKELLARKESKEREIKDSGVDLFDEVDEEAIAEVLSVWTGIPVYKLTEEETQKLLRMEDELHKRVVGQQDAIKAVSQAIRRTRAGLKDPKRPSGSFIFLGPSGVGKTELAKTLAEFLFGDETALIQLDMSEYMEKHTVSRLVGSPPGYVGYEEGGQLTEAVRRKPFSVVLFDEIEKAHPDVFNTLLQILEEGRLTDAQGRSVDFRNTVLIMTSNLGTADLRKANVGFARADEALSYTKMREKVDDALKQHFRPEFLNRIDETIVFHELTKDEVTEIVDLMIKRVQRQLESQGLGLELTQEAKYFLADKGYDPQLGARPLRRAIQRQIEDPVSERLLVKEVRAGEIVVVDAVNGATTLDAHVEAVKQVAVADRIVEYHELGFDGIEHAEQLRWIADQAVAIDDHDVPVSQRRRLGWRLTPSCRKPFEERHGFT